MFFYFLLSGIGGAIFAIFFIPVLAILTLSAIRIFAEVFAAILIVPHQLFTIISEIKRLRLLIEQRGGSISITQQPPNQAINFAPIASNVSSFSNMNIDGDRQFQQTGNPMIVQVSPSPQKLR